MTEDYIQILVGRVSLTTEEELLVRAKYNLLVI